ncbi:MAG: hypothetical protein CMC82_09365 [Flavobacteriaceae bacterium]|nr:hypothetical protein [Flavobacteriaceae bacterium]|tara:strand:- start:8909 stop:10702 length:1794 start_codon:yes stop_codon:yes gene_type:complete
MAPTFRPYQSVGQGLNQLNLPEGAEAREASRTMTVLSRSIDQMSNFFFKQAEDEARIEGEKFGIEYMSLDKVREANKNNKDIFDIPEFGNTVFGKTARASALTVLENETLIEATKTLNDLVFNAETNNTNPTILRNQIDASIKGYVDALQPSAPVLAKKVSARLQVNGASAFDSYRSAHAKATTASLQATALKGLFTKFDQSKADMNTMFSQGKIEQTAIDLLRDGYLKELDNSTYGLKRQDKKDFAKLFDENIKSFIKEKAFEFASNSQKPFDAIKKIRTATTDDPNLNRLLKLRLSNFDFRRTMTTEIRTLFRQEQEEQNTFDTNKENERKQKVENRKKQFFNAVAGKIDYDKADTAIRLMLEVDVDEAQKLKEELAKAGGGVRLESDLSDTRVVKILTEPDLANYTDLNTLIAEGKLSNADILNLDKTIDANIDDDYKGALAIVMEGVKYNETGKLIKAQDKTSKLREQAYLTIKKKLVLARDEAQRNNTPVDLVRMATDLVADVDSSLKNNLTDLKRNKLSKKLARIRLLMIGEGVENIPQGDDVREVTNFIINYYDTIKGDERKLKKFGLNKDSVLVSMETFRTLLRELDDE